MGLTGVAKLYFGINISTEYLANFFHKQQVQNDKESKVDIDDGNESKVDIDDGNESKVDIKSDNESENSSDDECEPDIDNRELEIRVEKLLKTYKIPAYADIIDDEGHEDVWIKEDLQNWVMFYPKDEKSFFTSECDCVSIDISKMIPMQSKNQQWIDQIIKLFDLHKANKEQFQSGWFLYNMSGHS